MPYTPTTWVFSTTMGTYTRLNNLETQYTEATNSFEQDLLTPFVYSGMVCTKDGTIANQLDITAGLAFPMQADNTLRRRGTLATTKTTATPSTTYYLYLQPDGTWYWSTSNSPAANSLAICQVTTDGSGNINAGGVTDKRVTTTTLLASMVGSVNFPGGLIVSQQSGSANGISFKTWNGTAGIVPFSVGGQFNSALSYVDASGNLVVGGYAQINGSGLWSGAGTLAFHSQQSGAANGISFATWSGSAGVVPFSVGGAFGGALAYVDASGNLYAPRFNGTLASTFFYPPAVTNGIIVLTAWNGSLFQNCLLTNADGSIQIGGNYIKSGQSFLGFKDSSGNKLAEFKNSALILAGSSSTAFSTTGGSAGFGNSASFDAFDVAEAYEADSVYARGAVLCPGPNGRLTRCTHDKCRAAFVVSAGGAVNIGGAFSDAEDERDPRILPMALVGRVLVDTDEAIAAFASDGMPTLVTSNGRGGVRAMRPRERGFALGYALTDARDGRVGVVVRPVYCQAPIA